MGTKFVELFYPGVEIGLQFVDRRIDLLAEGDAIELVEHGLVKALDDAVGLRALGLGARVVNVLDGEIEFVFVPLGIAAIFGSAIGEHALQRDAALLEERDCDAYASWQKGGVENANGRLRRWLPRHLDVDLLSDEEIQDIVITANLTPRKCLGFKTPFQALLAELGKDVAIRFA
jgi:IS30 family transposase